MEISSYNTTFKQVVKLSTSLPFEYSKNPEDANKVINLTPSHAYKFKGFVMDLRILLVIYIDRGYKK